jgi:hypothetical protein
VKLQMDYGNDETATVAMGRYLLTSTMRYLCGVEVCRSGLGGAYLLPALSSE